MKDKIKFTIAMISLFIGLFLISFGVLFLTEDFAKHPKNWLELIEPALKTAGFIEAIMLLFIIAIQPKN